MKKDILNGVVALWALAKQAFSVYIDQDPFQIYLKNVSCLATCVYHANSVFIGGTDD